MRQPTQREWVLIGIMIVIGAAVLFFRDGNLLTGGSAGKADEELDLGEAPVVHLARLNQDPEAYDPAGRDLFKYGPPPRVQRDLPPPPKPVTVERPKPKPTPPPPRATPKPQPVRPAAPRPPKIDFEYLGFLGPKDDRIFVFTTGEELLLARMGETVQTEFKVVEFGYETVVMGYTDSRFAGQTAELNWNR